MCIRDRGADDGLFETPDVGQGTDPVGQRQDRIADQLARTVVGDQPAAVDLDDGRPVDRTLLGRGPASGRLDRRLPAEQHLRTPLTWRLSRIALALHLPPPPVGGQLRRH